MFRKLLQKTKEKCFISSFQKQLPLLFQDHEPDGFSWLMSQEDMSQIFEKKGSRYYKIFVPCQGAFRSFNGEVEEALRKYEEAFPVWIRNLKDSHAQLRELCFSLDRVTLCKESFASLAWIPEQAEEFTFSLGLWDAFYLNMEGEVQLEVSVPKDGESFKVRDIDPGGKGWEKVKEISLSKGEMIYIPRNNSVTVKPAKNEAAKIIVLGFLSYTWGDVIDKVLYVKSPSKKELKDSVPTEWLKSSQIVSSQENEAVIEKFHRIFTGQLSYSLAKAIIRKEIAIKRGVSGKGNS
ncbi:MAG: hypothetical protein ACI9S8_001163 [Chlamydiales bacterium]|jgi:hypothetical protein